jgi:hypothetical protein
MGGMDAVSSHFLSTLGGCNMSNCAPPAHRNHASVKVEGRGRKEARVRCPLAVLLVDRRGSIKCLLPIID